MTRKKQRLLQDPVPTPEVRAWCVGLDRFYPDYLICSGLLCAELGGQPCPRADNGRMPLPIPVSQDEPFYSLDKGRPGDLCPPCCASNLSSLEHWQGHNGQIFPESMLPLRVFKCSVVGAWWVVPGLYDTSPTQ